LTPIILNLYSKYFTKEAPEGFRLQIRTSNTPSATEKEEMVLLWGTTDRLIDVGRY
jgi:hypothetical protein